MNPDEDFITLIKKLVTTFSISSGLVPSTEGMSLAFSGGKSGSVISDSRSEMQRETNKKFQRLRE